MRGSGSGMVAARRRRRRARAFRSSSSSATSSLVVRGPNSWFSVAAIAAQQQRWRATRNRDATSANIISPTSQALCG